MLVGQLVLLLIGIVFIVCGGFSSINAKLDVDWIVPSIMWVVGLLFIVGSSFLFKGCRSRDDTDKS